MENPYQALLAISEELSTLRDTDTLFNRVMDIATSTLKAERGFILLKSTGTERAFEAVCARNISRESITSLRELSSSIVNQVLEDGQALLAVDAQADDRFAGAESVVVQNIRSVICTPLLQNNETVGAIYMDTRTSAGKFDQASLDFLQAFAAPAAIAIENARLFEKLRSENARLKQRIDLNKAFPKIIGKSPAIMAVLKLIDDVADSSASILIEGESGTGKELVAQALHNHSSRAAAPFIPLFCGSLSEQLLESELFGHRKGAFTGAVAAKAGLFEIADGGTIFLDEIVDINKNIQTKLLRVLQEGEIKAVGDTRIRKVDVRIISASNKDLWQAVQDGHFREDLFYRLNVINLKLPPLRNRREDITLLAGHFLKKYNARNNKQISGFTTEALASLQDYHWPGNIRELENAIERSVILCHENKIDSNLFLLNRPATPQDLLGKPLAEIEKFIILKTLEMNDNNRTRAAKMLDVSRRWLQYRLKEWGHVDSD